ncbi:hypothetical protein JFQ86_05835 [Serratia ureilytica]|uniref:hypothetical protein n=1 Tax=Serratia TaxID=613 RepID=UPI0018E79E40|nr:hypothetical protein [Serratia ureilytica]MBJ2112343.1 hypothetical protein [Serratia ureilytica]
MNIIKQFECDTCCTHIDCRIGLSNRDVQPFQFACPVCEQQITFKISAEDFSLEGASDILDFETPFSGKNPFIDLHLDFPATFEKYVMGYTTFMKVTQEIGHANYVELNSKLDALNSLYPKKKELRRLITQYKRGEFNTFRKTCRSLFDIQPRTDKKQDIIAALYKATSIMSSPFTIHEHNKEISEEMPKILREIDLAYHGKNNEFFTELIKTGFLQNVHHECLSIYPKVIELELPLRPALYFDYKELKPEDKISGRVSTTDFETCSNLYKDLSEVFSRLLTLVAGVNNLLKRGDHNIFDDSVRLNKKLEVIKELSSLDNFTNMDLGKKVDCIDNSFYIINKSAINSKLRNAIAHYKYEYEESTQLIKYYPNKEGMRREKLYEISFLEFLRNTLMLFREVHLLNHIVKSMLYYTIFILKK